MHSSSRCLDELEKRSVCGWRGIYCVGGDPEVFLALVDHLPHPLEEGVTLDYEFSVWKSFDWLQIPCCYLLLHCFDSFVEVGIKDGVDVHIMI